MLNGVNWGDAIADAIIAASSGLDASEEQIIRDGWRTIAGEHAAHISANAEVSVDLDQPLALIGNLGAPVTGAQTGSGGVS